MDSGSEDKPIVCRIFPAMWTMVGLMGIFGGLLLWLMWTNPPQTQESQCFAWVFLGIIFTTIFLLSYRLLRYRVIADRDGIRWRGLLHGWRSVPWSAVSDYYQEQKSQFEGGTITRTITVVTSSGNVCMGDPWTNNEPFKKFVQHYAVNARVNEWERRGVRRVDAWPRNFTYWDNIRSYVEFCQEVRRLAPPTAEVILQQPAKEIVHR